MSTHTQILYQIIFSTKYREPTLMRGDRPSLFRFIWGILKNNNCHLYRLNGVEDHLHILTHLHPSVALANLVKDIKLAGTDHIKNEGLFKRFNGWQDGYGAFTYSIDAKNTLIEYVKNQEEHHRKKTFREEYIELLKDTKSSLTKSICFDFSPSPSPHFMWGYSCSTLSGLSLGGCINYSLI